MATTQKVYGEESLGAWFNNALGIYLGDEVIKLAIEHGFKPGIEPTEGSYSHHEDYCDVWSEAEDFMQQFAGEGLIFCHHEDWGDFGLWRMEEEN